MFHTNGFNCAMFGTTFESSLRIYNASMSFADFNSDDILNLNEKIELGRAVVCDADSSSSSYGRSFKINNLDFNSYCLAAGFLFTAVSCIWHVLQCIMLLIPVSFVK